MQPDCLQNYQKSTNPDIANKQEQAQLGSLLRGQEYCVAIMSPNPPDLSTSFISSTFRLKHREVEKNQAPEQFCILLKNLSLFLF